MNVNRVFIALVGAIVALSVSFSAYTNIQRGSLSAAEAILRDCTKPSGIARGEDGDVYAVFDCPAGVKVMIPVDDGGTPL